MKKQLQPYPRLNIFIQTNGATYNDSLYSINMLKPFFFKYQDNNVSLRNTNFNILSILFLNKEHAGKQMSSRLIENNQMILSLLLDDDSNISNISLPNLINSKKINNFSHSSKKGFFFKKKHETKLKSLFCFEQNLILKTSYINNFTQSSNNLVCQKQKLNFNSFFNSDFQIFCKYILCRIIFLYENN
jgi:hypothetical protein